MASFIFKPLPGVGRQSRYSFELSRLGRGLPRKKQMSSADMESVGEIPPNTYPVGTDRKAPRLPGDK